jgi:hypothetical protein
MAQRRKGVGEYQGEDEQQTKNFPLGFHTFLLKFEANKCFAWW